MRKILAMTILFALSLLCFLACSACTVVPSSNASQLTSFYHQTAVPLETLDASANVNGCLPEQVYIKTLTQTFCRDYQFCIVDGRIYYKLMPGAKYSNPGLVETDWQLVGGTGLPTPQKSSDFPLPTEIVEISADADALLAFDSDGGMYQMFTSSDAPGRPFQWIWDFGWPERTHLVQNQLVKNKRAWASAARRQDVLWHEDIYGNPHHYGTMGIETIYFLTEDGQHIRFTDSGLPADFSRSLQGPEEGTFIAENLSASASTLFVINKAGTMYTRLADFDTIGCDPMFFKYTYERLPQKYDGTQYLSNYSPWALPSEPWLRQPDIPLEGQARLTRHITILQNGQGNAARELRVAGTNAQGETGYYSKAIFAHKPQDWSFVAAPLQLAEDTFLPVTAEGVPQEVLDNLSGPSQKLRFSGSVWQEGRRIPELTCTVRDFFMSEGACTLELSYRDETKSITLHPVEMWSYMFRHDPGRDGTQKNFFVTFEYPAGSLESNYPEFQSLLHKLFADKNKVVFSSHAAVTENLFHLTTAPRTSQKPGFPLSSRGDSGIPKVATSQQKRNDFIFILTGTGGTNGGASPTMSAALDYTLPALSRFTSEQLRLEPGTLITAGEEALLDRIIQNNQSYRQMLVNELELFHEYSSKSTISRWGYTIADILTTVTLLNQVDFPKIKTATTFGGSIMEQNARTYRAQFRSKAWTYSHLLELLDMRIGVYTAARMALQEEGSAVAIPVSLHDSHYEFLTAAEFPPFLSGSSPLLKKCAASIQLMPDIPLFPGFCLVLQEEGETYLVLVELEDSVRKLYHYDVVPSAPFPLTFSARFTCVSESGILPKDLRNLHQWRGTVQWDGEELVVTAQKGLFGRDVLFSGKAISAAAGTPASQQGESGGAGHFHHE